MTPEPRAPVKPELKAALRGLRQVKSQRPADSDAFAFANWREDIATALETLARYLPHEEDRTRAKAEANEARKQAARTRATATHDTNDASGGGPQAPGSAAPTG